MDLSSIKKAHFLGIGGIGISALAQLFIAKGIEVTGSDLEERPIMAKLKKKGAKIFIGEHKSGNVVDDVDIIVYTSEVPQGNPEIERGRSMKIPIISYAEGLGMVMGGYESIVTVAGTNGKTTTTSMAGIAAELCKLDPTVVTGTIMREWEGNLRLGSSKLIIAEACEWKRNFLNYKPDIAVVTNVQAEHLDYYNDLDDIKSAFAEYAGNIRNGGLLVACRDDSGSFAVAKKYEGNKIFYGLKRGSEIRAVKIRYLEGRTLFDVKVNSKILGKFHEKDFEIFIPGEHNVLNSLAVIAAMLKLGSKIADIKKALSNYKGSARRFELKGEKDGVLVIDDYAHMTVSIEKTIEGAKAFYPGRRIWVVFEPHRYSRTRHEFDELVRGFDEADKVVLSDIYKLPQDTEEDVRAVSGELLVEKVRKRKVDVKYIPKLEDIPQYLRQNTKKGDIILTMGAGDVWKVGEQFLG